MKIYRKSMLKLFMLTVVYIIICLVIISDLFDIRVTALSFTSWISKSKQITPFHNATMTTDFRSAQSVDNKDGLRNLAKEIRLNREQKEREYYSPRKTKVNQIEAKFLINGAQICNTDAEYMTILVIVPSLPSHFYVRDAIRSTYGSYVKEKISLQYIGANFSVFIRLAFLIGKDCKHDYEASLRNESMRNKDIIFADFYESYSNLTRKMLIAFHWINLFCSDVDFVMKVDEDVFVNIPKLGFELHKRPFDKQGSIYGYIYRSSRVHRVGKWAVPRDVFPLNQYPDYAAGNSYVISGNIIPRLLSVSEYLPYMSIEDAYITGCLAKIIDAKRVFVPGFTYYFDGEPNPCTFVRNKRISATKVTIGSMEGLWKACTAYKDYCSFRYQKQLKRPG
ncbi:hypothetical protein ACF0H5_001643 [Mactra antiquata]